MTYCVWSMTFYDYVWLFSPLWWSESVRHRIRYSISRPGFGVRGWGFGIFLFFGTIDYRKKDTRVPNSEFRLPHKLGFLPTNTSWTTQCEGGLSREKLKEPYVLGNTQYAIRNTEYGICICGLCPRARQTFALKACGTKVFHPLYHPGRPSRERSMFNGKVCDL